MKTVLFTLLLTLTLNISFAQYNVFWGDKASSTISSTLNDMDEIKLIASEIVDVSRVKIDPINQKVYWAEKNMGKIWRSNFDGTNVQEVVSVTGQLSVFAIDQENELIYFSDNANKNIMTVDLDGKNKTTFASDIGSVKGFAFDHMNKQVFWTDLTHGNITQASLDGTGREVVFENEDMIFFDLASDPINEQLYFTDRSSNEILRIDYFGQNLSQVIELTNLAGAISLDPELSKIFFKEGDQLNMANMDGTNVVMLAEGIMELSGLDVYNKNAAQSMARKK